MAKTKRRKSQTERVKTWLLSGKTINPLTAVKRLGVLRLAAIVYILRNTYNMNITTDTRKGYATYKLAV
mgnify:FL=1